MNNHAPGGGKDSPSTRPEIPPELEERLGAIPEQGLFASDSVIWKVSRERVTLLGGPAAAVLQVAHPKVGLGVAEHSDFRRDTYGRLKRTLASVYTISFGTRREVAQIARKVYWMHQLVKSSGSHSGGKYSALDADAQMWVLATLISGAVFTYEKFVGLLMPEEKEAYFQEMRLWGEFFGLQRDYGPQSWPEFEKYYDDMLHGTILGSSPVSPEVVRNVVFPRNPWLFRLSTRPLEFLVTEMIPSPLLERLGLRSKFWTRLAWSLTPATVRMVRPALPPFLRYPVEYRRAVRFRRTLHAV